MNNMKTRFAPSPTGYLHIGGARTALFNYAYAKHYGGKFVLRIEDTDFERSEKKFEEDIIESLKWLSIFPDEEIIFQSDRLNIYRSYIDKLLKEDKAYYCFCSKELLEEDRNKLIAESKKPMYVGRCRELKPDEALLKTPHVIRFRVDRSPGVATGFKDLIRNQHISVANDEIDDFVLVREDGIPTYNFAVVIDDALTGITHIIRGDDHVSNTPKQIMLYNAFGFNTPEFAHVSMILGSDGKRLSKRHGATSVNQYKKEGFLPEALVNYLIRLGWSHGNDEIFSLEEIIKYFDLKNISKSAAIFNTEKLLWLNSHYIKSKDPFDLIDMINDIRGDLESPLNIDIKTASLVDSLKSRAKTLVELRQKLGFFVNETIDYKDEILSEFNFNESDLLFLKSFREFIDGLNNEIFNSDNIDLTDKAGKANALEMLKNSIESIKNEFNYFLSKNNWTMKEKAMIIRLAFTGEKVSPPIYEIIFAMGKERCIKRIDKFYDYIINIKR
ncbi:MAG: glutamate--tRNA ligase [Deltaproteobacteria bacterium]|nr:glutamate--tRNA ligase [Deltaproteobacteria bacterium]